MASVPDAASVKLLSPFRNKAPMGSGMTKDLPGFDRLTGFVASPAEEYPGGNGMTGVVSDALRWAMENALGGA